MSRRPGYLGIGIYAACLIGAWSLTALLASLAVGLWWHHHRWKPAVLALGLLAMTAWLGRGVWDLVQGCRRRS